MRETTAQAAQHSLKRKPFAMVFIPYDASDEQVLDIVREWIDILAREDYEAAFHAIAFHTPQETWTASFIRNAIKNYRAPEHYPGVEDFHVTNWRTAQGGNTEAKQEVIWYEPNTTGLAGAVAFDLPLNARWSNLTADFVLWENDNLEEGCILGLEDIGSWEQREVEAADAEPPVA